MYSLDVKSRVDKIFLKLRKKDLKTLKIINIKIDEICLHPYNEYKNLRYGLSEYKRVHINKSFVLIFKIDHANETVIVYDYDHHDRVYRNK